jgi:poly(A) polymerase
MIVLQRLRAAGHVAYFAGGCVRDLLLKKQPKDYDVATDAPPARVRSLFSNTQAVGAAFGVILVRENQSVVEVATFRTDMEYLDGRRPEGVKFATAEQDARRRDFTINGLFLDPVDDRVIDYVGGQDDLRAKLLRAIGNADERFAEDHLRLMRAVRFAARLDFQIEAATATAIVAHAHQLIRISPERVADELRRMLTGNNSTVAWRMLWELALIHPIFRFLPVTGDGETDFSRSIFNSMPARSSFGSALAVAAIDYRWQRAGRPDDIRPWLVKTEIAKVYRAMRQGLKISNEEGSELEGVLLGAAAMLAHPLPGVAAQKRFLATPTASATRAFLGALIACQLHVERIAQIQSELTELEKTEFAPLPLITGDDLTGAGHSPGPRFKLALDAAYDAQLENRISTRESALFLALTILSGGAGSGRKKTDS